MMKQVYVIFLVLFTAAVSGASGCPYAMESVNDYSVLVKGKGVKWTPL